MPKKPVASLPQEKRRARSGANEVGVYPSSEKPQYASPQGTNHRPEGCVSQPIPASTEPLADMAKITAIEMARKAQVNPELFRQVLCDENFDWHKPNDRWAVELGSEEHKAMQRVLSKIS